MAVKRKAKVKKHKPDLYEVWFFLDGTVARKREQKSLINGFLEKYRKMKGVAGLHQIIEVKKLM